MSVRLGYEPIPLVLHLARDTDFTAALINDEGWPAGTAIALLLGPTPGVVAAAFTWPATITGTLAAWSVPTATVAAALDADARHVRLRYTDPSGTTVMWARGRVQHG